LLVVDCKHMSNAPVQNRQRGQALTEFVVMCLVLVPLFVLLPMLGKYIDINHATIKASRYVAWERAVGRTNDVGEIARETRRRYFSRSDVAIKGRDGASDKLDVNPLWVDSRNNPMLRSYDDVAIALASGANPNGGWDGLSSDIRRKFNLHPTGIVVGKVQADIGNASTDAAPVSRLAATMAMRFQSRTAIIGDVWAARDATEVEHKTRGGSSVSDSNVPQLAIVGSLGANALGVAGVFMLEPAVSQFDVQTVKPDIVPDSRLAPYPATRATRGQ
jgi:hypothetical protein